MKKRILSILLLCCMVLTLLPTAAFAAGEIDEQFTLAPGGTYYFDLSAMGIPGTVNDALPDKTMRYIPFTYAGTVDAYKLTSAMAATDEYAETNKYAHSLFVADYTVTHTVSWDELNAGRLIFGRDYAAGGVDYILRAPSVGSGRIGSAESQRGTPPSNEWDRILDKNDGYIKNWFGMYSWGQDTLSTSASDRAARGYFPPGGWSSAPASHQDAVAGFRPVLEVLTPGSLGSDGLKAVTLDLGGGKLGDESSIQIIVETGSVFTAPASDGLTRPDGNTGNYFMWRDNDGQLYAPGDYVPADVTKLTAQFNLPEQFTLAPGGTYYFDLSAMGIPGTVNDALPDKTMGYVPFTYAGTVDSYKLTSEMATTEEYAQQSKYAHGLFIADFAVTHEVSWDNLNAKGLIFGKNYTAGGVSYTLRAPSVGSDSAGSGDSQHGTPQSNEWDRILDKNDGYIKNWSRMHSWGQDTSLFAWENRVIRGSYSARYWTSSRPANSRPTLGFRPVLEILNTDPLISDSDRDLGDKNSNFTITYTVDDADSGDVLTATESLDGQTTKSFAPTRNLVNTISVDVDSLSLGKHTVKVVVSDGQGGTATRTWTFTRTNSAPTISGSDGNLGDKNLGFTYAYTIDDADGDTLTVVEELNDETIRTINNAPKGEELTVTITSEKLYALGLNSVNTLKITVTDGKGGTAYRRVTFKRTNSAPTISGQDKALGLKNGSFAENYTVSDVEGDNVVVTEFVDDVQIRSYQATLGQQETIELTREKWLSLTNGQHQLRIEAVDGNFATSVRVFSFSKKETVIKFELAAPEETDAAATKVLVTPTWKIEGAVAKVEACNNGFDAVPTWEDITAMVQINRVYNFTNKTKTASKWGVNIRFTITKNEGFEGEVSISGFGGAYE